MEKDKRTNVNLAKNLDGSKEFTEPELNFLKPKLEKKGDATELTTVPIFQNLSP